MFSKVISTALIFLAASQVAVAFACGDPPLPACPSFPPCPPCASTEFCCYTLGSKCVEAGGLCPKIGASD
ncbi:hypothetical protein B0H16DRAFT_1879842 [Mycena metata]|uniref:Granulins domain-containing protein n=1 Tax=Mycena metata TaxID=1033252 RepID=A0AAD7NUB2_9AGAR|nr:hypothetical protein B0H16DRAFT_1879842 [Mycena metata]